MAIRTVVTSGFGNATFSGTVALVVTAGYAIGEAAAPIDRIFFTNITAYPPRATVNAYPPRASNVSTTEPPQ